VLQFPELVIILGRYQSWSVDVSVTRGLYIASDGLACSFQSICTTFKGSGIMVNLMLLSSGPKLDEIYKLIQSMERVNLLRPHNLPNADHYYIQQLNIKHSISTIR
jgi:intergrase/recombinase